MNTIGELFKFKTLSEEENSSSEKKTSFCLRGEPYLCLRDYLEINDTKVINNKLISECSQIPEDPGYWVVTDSRTLFDKRGYAFKVLKVANIKTGSNGWVAEKSVLYLKNSKEGIDE